MELFAGFGLMAGPPIGGFLYEVCVSYFIDVSFMLSYQYVLTMQGLHLHKGYTFARITHSQESLIC